MKVGLEISYAFMGRGGIDRYAYGLADALLARDDADDFVLFTLFAPFRRSGLDGAPILSPPRRKLAMAQVELLRLLWSRLGRPHAELLAGPVDLVHATHHFAVPVRRARLVATVHDLSFEHPELEIANASRFSRDARAAVARADAVITPSEFTKGELVERYGVSAERVRVIPPGVDTPRWSNSARASAAPPYFLAAGQIEPRKNLLELAEGFTLARERFGLPHRLVVVGRPARSAQPILASLQRTQEIVYRGFVADAELEALYRGATAFLYPSRYEGFGLSLLEAMAAGTPVVASAAASLPEVVGDAGLLVDPGDPERWAHALQRIASDERLRTALVEAGHARAGAFTWERAAAATVELYHEVGTP